MPKYVILVEILGGVPSFMLYRRRWFFGLQFLERWNTAESALTRVAELRH